MANAEILANINQVGLEKEATTLLLGIGEQKDMIAAYSHRTLLPKFLFVSMIKMAGTTRLNTNKQSENVQAPSFRFISMRLFSFMGE